MTLIRTPDGKVEDCITTQHAAKLLLRAIDSIPRPDKAMSVACKLLSIKTEQEFWRLRLAMGDEKLASMIVVALDAVVDKAVKQ